ncbi:MAG: glycerol-3-phosphate dehydrogenase/oxidase [Ktedonobacteraceae bacterium]|nr:glycerol-3-phosphate dehydrogenase/oxidase [Ktedonobacteraceae bacterium]
MQPLSSRVRRQNFAKLEREHFDVLVIGGGITGAGVALDAAARSYKVALVERADFASGASSKSTKLIHGGIRYLPNFDFALVHQGLVERGLLLQNAPFLVEPLAFVLPIYEGDRHPVGMPFTTPGGIGLGQLLDLGLLLYDGLAGRRNIKRHRHLSREQVQDYAPALVTERLKEGFMYYDAHTNDVRLTLALLRTAAQFGATLVNYAEVTSFRKESGTITGACVCDRMRNQEMMVGARHIVNATGVFSQRVEALTGAVPMVQIEPSKGIHLVFSREDVQLADAALVLPETDDRRLLFLVPWQSRVILGTTDTGADDLDHPMATRADVAYLLNHLNRYFSLHLTTEHIISTYAGYRPLVKSRTGAATAKLSRNHTVLQSPSGLVTIVGGKLTTYRRMAQDTVDVLSRRDGYRLVHPTENLPLQGSVGCLKLQQVAGTSRSTVGTLDEEIVAHLGRSYGTETQKVLQLIAEDASLGKRLVDDLPYLRAEVVYACRYEMAMTPYDVLARRTSITLEDRQRGLGVVDTVARLMAREHGWTTEQRAELVVAYRAAIEQQMAAEVARGETA